METQVGSARNFISTLGVNTHAGHATGSYQNTSLTLESLAYLGVSNVRDGFRESGMSAELLEGLGAADIKIDFVVPSDIPQAGAAGLKGWIDGLKAFNAAHPGSIASIEGLNEFNLYGFSYNGDSSVAGAVAFQKALYTSVKQSGSLGWVPVLNFSIGMDDKALFDAAGDLSNFADYANSHSYTHTRGPIDNTQEYQLSLARKGALRDPVIITETGYSTLTTVDYLGASEKAQAKLILNGLFDAYQNGVSKTYLYELFDGNTADRFDKEAHFGLFRTDGSPKPAAIALHNLTTILAFGDTDATTETGGLGYALSGMPRDAHSYVLTKSNGAKDLVLWAEPKIWDDVANVDVINPGRAVKVTLSEPHALIYVYDPLKGTAPIAVYRNTKSFDVLVSDHPVIVEVDARGPVTVAPTVVAGSQTLTSAELVSQIHMLSKATGLQSINLIGTHVLNVSSAATMKYMISEYQNVLSKIQGGYSFAIDLKGNNWSLTTNFDAAGRKTSEVHFAYDSERHLTNRSTHFVDGSEIADFFSGGQLVQRTETKSDGSSRATKFENGAAKSVYIKNTDGTAESIDYQITGQRYTSQKQVFDPDGVLVFLERKSANTIIESASYDGAGRLLESYQKTAKGDELHSTYVAGKLKALYVEHANGKTEAFDYGITGKNYVSQHQSFSANGDLLVLERTNASGKLVYTELRSGSDMIYTTYNSSGVRLETTIVHSDGSRDTYRYDGASSSAFVLRSYDETGQIEQSVSRLANGTETNIKFSQGVAISKYTKHADGSAEASDYSVRGTQSHLDRHQKFSATGTMTELQTYHSNGHIAYSEVNHGGVQERKVFTAAGQLKERTTSKVNGDEDSLFFALDGKGAVTHQVKKAGVVAFTDVKFGDGRHEVTANSNGLKLDGGAGNDTFIFKANASGTILYEGGDDRVRGFDSLGSHRPDHIALTSQHAQNMGDLNIKQNHADVVVMLDHGGSITLLNTKMTSLSADFITFL